MKCTLIILSLLLLRQFFDESIFEQPWFALCLAVLIDALKIKGLQLFFVIIYTMFAIWYFLTWLHRLL